MVEAKLVNGIAFDKILLYILLAHFPKAIPFLLFTLSYRNNDVKIIIITILHLNRFLFPAIFLGCRKFSTLMSANWPLMSVNVFFVGYGAPCPLMVQAQRSCGNGR